MVNSFIKKGRLIKMEVETTPPYMCFDGIIKEADEKFLVVAIEGQYVQSGTKKVKCKISDELKVCMFETTIIEAKGNRLFIEMPDPDKVQIIQRREYVRVPVDIKVNCHLLGIGDEDIDKRKIFPGQIRDISGGGVLMNTAVSLPIDTLIVFELKLEHYNFVLTAKVVRNIEDANSRTWNLGCEFIGIDESDRQKIISYCTKRQLHLKKR